MVSPVNSSIPALSRTAALVVYIVPYLRARQLKTAIPIFGVLAVCDLHLLDLRFSSIGMSNLEAKAADDDGSMVPAAMPSAMAMTPVESCLASISPEMVSSSAQSLRIKA